MKQNSESISKNNKKKLKCLDFVPACNGVKELVNAIKLFWMPAGIFILLSLYFWFLQKCVGLLGRLQSITLLVIYFFIAHIFIDSLVTQMWAYIKIKRSPDKLTGLLGYIDRIIYSVCFAFQQYTFIGVWLGIKIASRLIEFKSVEITNNPKKDEKKIKPIGQRKNVYLIGNLISLVLGIGAGYLIILVFSLPQPNFWKN